MLLVYHKHHYYKIYLLQLVHPQLQQNLNNQVSCTATFDPEREADELPHVLNYFQYRLKGISLLPRKNGGAYKQMPYEAIDEKTYHFEVEKLGHLSFVGIEGEEADIDKFCNNDVCEIEVMS